MSLDKLRAINKAASPGEWWAESGVVHSDGGDVHPLFVGSPNIEANAQLAVLSKLLLPAFEALEEGPCDDNHEWPDCKLHENCTSICSRCCVLKALEEALG